MATVAILGTSAGRHMQRLLSDAGHRTVSVESLAALSAAAHAQRMDVILIARSGNEHTTMPELVRTITRDPQFTGVAVMPVLLRSDLASRVRSLWYGAANIVNLPLLEHELLAGVSSVARRERPAENASPVL